jgi:hypothetical protein
MAFWLLHISDEFRNQKNFSYFINQPQLKIKSDLNTQAPEYHSPRKQQLNIDLDFIENYIESPVSTISLPNLPTSPRENINSPISSPRSLPGSPPKKERNIKVYKNKKYNKKK